MSMTVQLVGSALILLAFVLAQAGRLGTGTWSYLWLNFAGSGLTAGDALYEEQWGFLLLEGAWMVVSLLSLIKKAGRGGGAGSPAGAAR
ncbi:CBU_0592 family membrane protein [Streptomyces sp. NPDC055189]